MLSLKNIKKYYQVGETLTKAQDDVSIAFREREFVAILGPSGSGKTTMLNIIGGLDRYDSGDLLIKGKSTKTFADADWDAYRNNSVGFIFQSYNLISHLSIIENVELGMTLSGISAAEKRKRTRDALIRVGLEKHMDKQPAQLSGGQMQRVAIARAIANDPAILLADEPTGALDSETSNEIMQLIKELSKERLVIMVTHNPELAHQYADRIIEFADGKIEHDSNPFIEADQDSQFQLTHTKMSYWTALKLSFTNIATKKGRTFLTTFASSIGIIGIAIVLALSNGFQKQIDNTQSETMAAMPVTISQVAADQKAAMQNASQQSKGFAKDDYVTAKPSDSDMVQHVNKLTPEYVKYVKQISKKDARNIAITYGVGLNLLRKEAGKYQPVSFSNVDTKATAIADRQDRMAAMTGVGGAVYPIDRNGKQSFLKKNYRVLAGEYPKSATDIVLVVDKHNNVDINALKNLKIKVKANQKFQFDQLVGTKIKLVANDDFYRQLPTGNFLPNNNYQRLANAANTKTLTVTGILRVKSKNSDGLLANGVAYSDQLTRTVLKANQDSQIVKAQQKSNRNVMSNQPVDQSAKQQLLAMLGGKTTPTAIQVYPTSFKNKDKVLNHLDDFNRGKAKANQILYTDLAGTVSSMTGGLMDTITYVLIAFAAISLVTSMIMIAIITYTSVLERTKEIGVLKALGARKRDITRVFDAETAILGVGSGILGIVIAWLATFPINSILANITGLAGVAVLNPLHAVILIIISTILTIMGGHIPARMAAKKDAAIALRSE